MTKFIKLTSSNNTDLFVNPDNVTFVAQTDKQIIGTAAIQFINGLTVEIKGSPTFNAELLSGETEPLT